MKERLRPKRSTEVGWKPGTSGFLRVLRSTWRVFVLTSRLEPDLGAKVLAQIRTVGRTTQLLVTENNRMFRIPRRVTSDTVELKFRYGLDEIQQSTKLLAQKAFNKMLERCFGWTGLEDNTFANDFTEYAKGGSKLDWT